MEQYIVGIDPGPGNSAFAILDTDSWNVRYVWYGSNTELVKNVAFVIPPAIKEKPIVVYERMRQYEVGAGDSVFQSCKWYGRFIEGFFHTYKSINNPRIFSMTSPDVKLALLGLSNPSNAKVLVKRAVCEHFPQCGAGATPAVGTKAQPGSLFVMRSVPKHCWDALAVALVMHMWLKGKYTGDIIEEEPSAI